MASATQLPGAILTSQPSNPSASPSLKTAQFSAGITYLLFLWPSLSLAVTNNWGGPSSADKREWFVGETITQLTEVEENADVDAEWIEEWLLQVMADEFEVVVEDDSAWEIAGEVVKLRTQCGRGEFGGVEELRGRWEARGGEGPGRGGGYVDGGEHEEEGSSGEEDGEEDVDMEEAPQLVSIKERAEPEVDEEGFTKVVKKRR